MNYERNSCVTTDFRTIVKAEINSTILPNIHCTDNNNLSCSIINHVKFIV